jgi:hypothetical protein
MAICVDELDQFKKNQLQDIENQLKYYQNVKNCVTERERKEFGNM